MELSPRTGPDVGDGGDPYAGDADGAAARGRPGRQGRRRWLPMGVLALVLVASGVIVFKALTDAATYFLNADEAVERRESLGDSRFRLQGMVLDGVTGTSSGTHFEVVHNCVVVQVRHAGDPPQMFSPGIPAVLEGRWHESGEYVETDRLFVAHDAEYQAEDEYEERIDEAEAGGAYEVDDCPEVLDDA